MPRSGQKQAEGAATELIASWKLARRCQRRFNHLKKNHEKRT